MTFTATYVMIFLIAFAILGGVVMFLSKTIDHGEAQFGPDGKVKSDGGEKTAQTKAHQGPARPAQRIDTNKASDNE